MLSDSSGHCCRLSTSIVLTVTSLCKNDLHLSYLRSSGIVQGGSRPCSSKSFGSDALRVAARAHRTANPGWGKRRTASAAAPSFGVDVVKLDESRH